MHILLIEYVNAFKKHTSRLASQLRFENGACKGGSITAHLEYHEGGKDGKPQRNAHLAIYPLPASVEMLAWTSINAQWLPQVKLARFLDDHLRDIRTPEGAAVLELAEGLEASKSAVFSSKIDRHKGGSRLYYDETVEAKTSAGNLDIPKKLTLSIPVFEGGKKHEIDARLALDVQGGKAVIMIQLVELHVVFREALAAVRAEISEATKLTILAGSLG